MSDRNPVEIGDEIEATIRRYLQAALPISHRYPHLKKEVAAKLNSHELLLKGPFVEALSDFAKGKCLHDLCEGSGAILSEGFASLDAIQRKRLLHRHQEQAIRAMVEEKKNIIVATGTGSGKTECFLYPILDSLLRDGNLHRPGIRALLIYPLNALANDQLYRRLVPLFVKQFGGSNITVGRYTGLTKKGVPRANIEAELLQGESFFRNDMGWSTSIPRQWLLTREEMRATPPHVLVTNYAMLEHMLLFPQNEGLFQGANLKFIVLDEVHTYSGAQATEVAFLLRKLKRRLGIERGTVRCIGTSASFGGSKAGEQEKVDREIIDFGEGLFGETFHAVIRGKRLKHSALGEDQGTVYSLPRDAWTKLKDMLPLLPEQATIGAWNSLLATSGVAAEFVGKLTLDGAPEHPMGPALVRIFAACKELQETEAALSGEFMPYRALAAKIFGDGEESEIALAGVIGVGIRARNSEGDFPLLPARYHFFCNGIDNVTLRLSAGAAEGFKDAAIGSVFSDERGPRYRLLGCRKCGQPFLEGFLSGTKLEPLPPGPKSNREVFLLPGASGGVDDEEDSEQDTAPPEIWHIDVTNGEIVASGDSEHAVKLTRVPLAPMPFGN